MPSSVVKTPEDERLWQKAKDRASEEGKADNYAYIMGIYKRMNPDRFDKSASRIADSFLATSKQAYDEIGRSPYGYNPGHVTPFQPTVGEGSQVPFARDHQGKPVALPDLGRLEIPGYEWHDTSKAFHQVVMKNARGETMKIGIDVRSFQARKDAWWDDFVALIKEYWSFQEVKLRKGRGGFAFEVQQMGTLRVEVQGPANKPTVRVLGKGEKQFDADESLWDILMWIDGVGRNGFTASTVKATLRSPASPPDAQPLSNRQEHDAWDAGYEAASAARAGKVDAETLFVHTRDSRLPRNLTEDDPQFYEWFQAFSDGVNAFVQEGHLASKIASDNTLSDVAEEVTRANEVLRDAADMLDAHVHGPSLADTYREAAEVSRALRSSTSRELAGMAAKLESAGRGRTASDGIDLAKEMRVLQRNVASFIQAELGRVRALVVRQFQDHGFQVRDVQIAPDRSGWLNIEGQIVDDADTWRSRDDVEALFMTMFDIYGHLSGSAPNWKFTMGGFQSFNIAASTNRSAS